MKVSTEVAPVKQPADPFGSSGDPFGPSPSLQKKPPPGAVAVLPPGGAPLIPGQQSGILYSTEQPCVYLYVCSLYKYLDPTHKTVNALLRNIH